MNAFNPRQLLRAMFDAAVAAAQPALCLPPHLPAVPKGRHDVADVPEITDLACVTARREGFGEPGQHVVISAGMPFGASGTTNLLRIAQIH